MFKTATLLPERCCALEPGLEDYRFDVQADRRQLHGAPAAPQRQNRWCQRHSRWPSRRACRHVEHHLVIGLMAGPRLYAHAIGRPPCVKIDVSSSLLILAGLLVGVGTRIGSGCTSGHGIIGIARGSRRSLAVTATFLVVWAPSRPR